MEWGIVASVLVAMGLLILGMIVICGSMFLLMARRMKKTAAAGGVPKCPDSPFRRNMSQCCSETQRTSAVE